MKYYIISGEASGDLHASNLMKAIVARDATAEFRFWGGDKMSAVGGTLVKHYKELAFMGFWEVFKNLPTVLRNISFCKRDILNFAPDALVLVDYPGFNLRIAEFAKKHNITTVYYISPQVWAWKKRRIKNIKRDIDDLMTILPFEKDFYAKHGMKVHYVGHPLLDAVSKDILSMPEVADFKRNHNFENEKIIALLPGSRKQEISAILPKMLQIADDFPQYKFVVSKVSWIDNALYDKYLQNSNIETVCDETYALLANAEAAVVASGTATLETALIGTPQIVCYAGSELSYLIAKKLVTGISYISLVNLIMDKPVVKELIQHDFNKESVCKELLAITNDENRISEMKRDYEKLYEILGGGSASENAAEIVVTAAKRS